MEEKILTMMERSRSVSSVSERGLTTVMPSRICWPWLGHGRDEGENAHSTWGVGHGTDDFCGREDPCSQLGYCNTSKDADEQFPVKSFLHPVLAEDSLCLVWFTAVPKPMNRPTSHKEEGRAYHKMTTSACVAAAMFSPTTTWTDDPSRPRRLNVCWSFFALSGLVTMAVKDEGSDGSGESAVGVDVPGV